MKFEKKYAYESLKKNYPHMKLGEPTHLEELAARILEFGRNEGQCMKASEKEQNCSFIPSMNNFCK